MCLLDDLAEVPALLPVLAGPEFCAAVGRDLRQRDGGAFDSVGGLRLVLHDLIWMNRISNSVHAIRSNVPWLPDMRATV